MTTIKNLECLFSQGKITRREFIARASTLGLTVAFSPLLFSSKARAATPKKGGRFRMGIAERSTTDSFDPSTIFDPGMMNVNWQVRNCLVEVDYRGNPLPELAESWEPTPDAKKWIFRLRKGVEFHNGKTLDAQDVIESISHHRKKESKSAAKSLLKPIEDIKPDGKNTVVFTLDSGNADFPYIVSDYHFCAIDFERRNNKCYHQSNAYWLL